MINLRKITPLNNEFMEKIGFAWHTDNNNSSYISDEIVQVKASEADAYYEAANELKNALLNFISSFFMAISLRAGRPCAKFSA